MPDSHSPAGAPAVPIQLVHGAKVSWNDLLQGESPPRTMGSLKSHGNSNIRDSIFVYRNALAQYELAKVDSGIPPLLKSSLRLRAREAFDNAKRVQNVVRNEDARYNSLESRMQEMAQGLLALRIDNLNRDQRMNDFVLGERDQNKSLAVVKGVVRRNFVDECRRRFYDGMINFLEEYYIDEVIRNKGFEQTYNPNKVPRSTAIDPEAMYTDLNLPTTALPDVEQSGCLFTDSSASGEGSVHSGSSIARTDSPDVGRAAETSGGVRAAHATTMSGHTAAAHATETSGDVPPAEKREAHPAMGDSKYFRSLNQWNRVDWNRFWDKLLLTDPVSQGIRYTHPVTKAIIERTYFWPSPALFSSWEKNIAHYHTRLREDLERAIEERDDLLEIANKKTPGNVWSKDIPLPGGSDPDEGSAEKALSQKLSKIKALVRSALPHRQLFVPRGEKGAQRRAKREKRKEGSTLVRVGGLKELSKAVDDVQANVTNENAATIFPEKITEEEIKKHDANIETLKDKLKLILFVEMAIRRPHILRDCIVACFPVKDEGNYYAHPGFPLDSELREHLRASMIELDPNRINSSLYECEGYMNGELSEDYKELVSAAEHDEDLVTPTTDAKVDQKGKGKQVH